MAVLPAYVTPSAHAAQRICPLLTQPCAVSRSSPPTNRKEVSKSRIGEHDGRVQVDSN